MFGGNRWCIAMLLGSVRRFWKSTWWFLLFINIGKEKNFLARWGLRWQVPAIGSGFVFIFLRTLSWWIRTWLVISTCFTEELTYLKRRASPCYSPPLSAPGQKSSELSSLPQEWSVSPETSRIFHLWLKWTSYVWEPWLWVKSANCLLMLPRSTNALKYRDIPQVLGSVRKSVGLSHSVPSFILQAPTSFFTALVLWTWEAVRSSSIHNQAQDFFKHSFTCFFNFNFHFNQDSGLLCLYGNASHPQQVEKQAFVKDKKLF